MAVASPSAVSPALAQHLELPPLSSADRDWIQRLRNSYDGMLSELRKRIVGQEETLEQLLIAFFAGGHALLVGVPGLAKTMMVRSLAETLSLDFARIQFTPDLMPSDITGTDIIGADDGSEERGFSFLGGPIFHNMILADEVNRTPPKTLAALLEAMEEYTVTVGGQRYEVPRPFFVMATQNPIEQEGTYTLPAAALDRFMFNIEVDYPEEEVELDIVEKTTSRLEERLFNVMSHDDVVKGLDLVRRLPVSDEIVEYATQIARYTRPEASELEEVRDYVAHGASPRAAQALIVGGKARAVLHGRDYVLGSDLRAIATPILRHRVVRNFHATSEGITDDELVRRVLTQCPRPGDDLTPEQEARQKARAMPRQMTTMLWGPETRKTQEARLRTQLQHQPTRLDQLARQSRKSNKLDPWSLAVAGISALLAVTYLGSAALLAFGSSLVPATISDTATPAVPILAALAGLFFLRGTYVFARGTLHFEARAEAGTFVLPLHGRGTFILGYAGLFLVQLLAIGFVGGQTHPVVTTPHILWPALFGITVPASGQGPIDWPGITLVAVTLLAVVILFAREESEEPLPMIR